MTQINMPAQQIKALINKSCQPHIYGDKVIISLRESKDSVITLIGHIQGDKIASVNATLIEQHYSGDDQLSSVATDEAEITSYLNNLTTSDKA